MGFYPESIGLSGFISLSLTYSNALRRFTLNTILKTSKQLIKASTVLINPEEFSLDYMINRFKLRHSKWMQLCN